MRRLTLKEVNEQHGGALPPDAVFRPDEDEEPARPAPTTKPKRPARSERFAVLNAFTDCALAALTGPVVPAAAEFVDKEAASNARPAAGPATSALEATA